MFGGDFYLFFFLDFGVDRGRFYEDFGGELGDNFYDLEEVVCVGERGVIVIFGGCGEK